MQNKLLSLCQSVLHMFSSRSFMVSSGTFMSLIHYEFIFVYGVRKCSNFILLHVAVQFSQHHLLKRLSFPPLYILASFIKDKVMKKLKMIQIEGEKYHVLGLEESTL